MTRVTYVDDAPDGLAAELRQKGLTVADFDEEDLSEAATSASDTELLLLDFFYGAQDFEGGDEAKVEDENGLSVFQKLKRRLGNERPTTALVSSDIEKALGPFRPERRHIVAERNGVEWVGKKDAAQIAAVATAAANLLRSLAEPAVAESQSRVSRLCVTILKAPAEAQWLRIAERQTDRARPPTLGAENAQGEAREIFAWLAHRVLPYSSFLISNREAAVRLGVSLASFDLLADPPDANDLSTRLGLARYSGPLHELFPPRWWRAGIDHLTWQLTQADGSPKEEIERHLGRPIEVLPYEDPVVVSDSDLIESDEFADAADCVRAQDEHFPPDVPPAWVKRTAVAEDDKLKAKVIFDDAALLEESDA